MNYLLIYMLGNFFDLVDYKTVQTMYKAHKNLLPDCIQRLLESRESPYELRGLGLFKKLRARTNIESRCVSVKGVSLWNGCDEELKVCSSVCMLKRMFKNMVVNKLETQV